MSKKYVQTLELEPDYSLIEFYINAHSPSQMWPEIVAGIKEVGIINMELFRNGTLLVMIIEAPDDFDFQASMDKLAKLPRQQEWEEYVGKAQKCDKNATSSGKWTLMERMFNLQEM